MAGQAKILDYYKLQISPKKEKAVAKSTSDSKKISQTTKSLLEDVCNDFENIDVSTPNLKDSSETVKKMTPIVSESKTKPGRISRHKTRKSTKSTETCEDVRQGSSALMPNIPETPTNVQQPKTYSKQAKEQPMDADAGSSFTVTDSKDDKSFEENDFNFEFQSGESDHANSDQDCPSSAKATSGTILKIPFVPKTYTRHFTPSKTKNVMSSDKPLPYRNARKITAKMKQAWAKQLETTGKLICPMPGCHQTYVTFANFQTHFKWCTEKKKLVHCPFCDSLIFSGKESVLRHMEVEHPDHLPTYKDMYEVVDEEEEPELPESANLEMACDADSIDSSDNSLQIQCPPVPKNRSYYNKRLKKMASFSFFKRYSTKKETGQKRAYNRKPRALKAIKSTMNKNIDEFKKCVRFNDIVQKISTATEGVPSGEGAEDMKPLKLKKSPNWKSTLVFSESMSDKETEYFVDDPDDENPDNFPPQRITTKARIVLNTQGYKRFSEYLKLTRDWASERRTYSRSRISESDEKLLQDLESLSPDIQDAFVLNSSFGGSNALAIFKSENDFSPKSMDEMISSIKSTKKYSDPNTRQIRSQRRILKDTFLNGTTTSDNVPEDSPLAETTSKPDPTYSMMASKKTLESDEVNYGHMLFSTPNKLPRRMPTTCYDNAGRARSPETESQQKLNLSFTVEDSDAPKPVIDFDTLLKSMNEPNTSGPAILPKRPKSEVKKEINNSKSVIVVHSRLDGVKMPEQLKKKRGRPSKKDLLLAMETEEYQTNVEMVTTKKTPVKQGKKAYTKKQKKFPVNPPTFQSLTFDAVKTQFTKDYLRKLFNTHNREVCTFCGVYDFDETYLDTTQDCISFDHSLSLNDTVSGDELDPVSASKNLLDSLVAKISTSLNDSATLDLFEDQTACESSIWHVNATLVHIGDVCSLFKSKLPTYTPETVQEMIEARVAPDLINSFLLSNSLSIRRKRRGRPVRMDKYLSTVLHFPVDQIMPHLIAQITSYLESNKSVPALLEIGTAMKNWKQANKTSTPVCRAQVVEEPIDDMNDPNYEPTPTKTKKKRGRPPKIKDDSPAAKRQKTLDEQEDEPCIKIPTYQPTQATKKAIQSRETDVGTSPRSVRKSPRIPKVKVDPDGVFEYPTMRDLKQVEMEPEVPVSRGRKPGRIKTYSTISVESVARRDATNVEAMLSKSDQDKQRVSRKSRPRKCVQYADLNSSVEVSENLDEVLNCFSGPGAESSFSISAQIIAKKSALKVDNSQSGKFKDFDERRLADDDINYIPLRPSQKSNLSLTSQRLVNAAKVCILRKQLKANKEKAMQRRPMILKVAKKPDSMPGSPKNQISTNQTRLEIDAMQKESNRIQEEIVKQENSQSGTTRSKRVAAMKARKLLVNLTSSLKKMEQGSSETSDEGSSDKSYEEPQDEKDKDFVVSREDEEYALSDEDDLLPDDPDLPALSSEEMLREYRDMYDAPDIEQRKATREQIANWVKELETSGKITCPRQGCGKVIQTKVGMIYHYQKACLRAGKKWHCKICNKEIFPTADCMTRHIKAHLTRDFMTPKLKANRQGSVHVALISKYSHLRDDTDFFPQLYHEQLFTEFKCFRSMWSLLNPENYEEYLPPLKQSAKFKVALEDEKVSDMWNELQCFESSDINENSSQASFFLGCPISSAVWCPTPNSENNEQYLAVATSTSLDTEYISATNGNRNCMFQLWGFGSLNDTKLTCKPELKLCIVLNQCTIWDIAWCPSGCYDNLSSTKINDNDALVMPRLGLVALACSDSCIRIYSLPQPDYLETNDDSLPIYKVQPVALLTPFYTELSKISQKSMCTSISWQRTDKSQLIACGYASGIIAIWQLSAENVATPEFATKTVVPFLTFLAHRAPITGVEFAPLSGGRWLASSCMSKSLKVWDLEDTSTPSRVLKKDSIGKNLEWPSLWTGPFFTLNENFALNAGVMYCDCVVFKPVIRNISQYDGHSWSSSVSELMNVVALGDSKGIVTVCPLTDLNAVRRAGKRTLFPVFRTEIEMLQQTTETVPCPMEGIGQTDQIDVSMDGSSQINVEEASEDIVCGDDNMEENSKCEIEEVGIVELASDYASTEAGSHLNEASSKLNEPSEISTLKRKSVLTSRFLNSRHHEGDQDAKLDSNLTPSRLPLVDDLDVSQEIDVETVNEELDKSDLDRSVEEEPTLNESLETSNEDLGEDIVGLANVDNLKESQIADSRQNSGAASRVAAGNNLPFIGGDHGLENHEAFSRDCGLVYIDSDMDKMIKDGEEVKKIVLNPEATSAALYNTYQYFTSVNHVAWNPNQGSQSWLFATGHSGIGRLMCIPEFDSR